MFYTVWQVLLQTFEPETLIKFNVLFGKSALECYKLLKEGSGPHETVGQWVNAIKNGWEEMDSCSVCVTPTSVTDEFHFEQVKSVCEHMRCISYMGITSEDGISPASASIFSLIA
jgi:hypothetical protein